MTTGLYIVFRPPFQNVWIRHGSAEIARPDKTAPDQTARLTICLYDYAFNVAFNCVCSCLIYDYMTVL